jgi:RNA polymerase sigma-70 factor (ECF subfamily)
MSAVVGSVRGMHRDSALVSLERNDSSRAWLQALASTGAERERAAARLHGLLVRAARFELLRRRAALEGRGESIEDLAVQSANSALYAILGKLDQYRFESRFTTWAYKFAILEAAVLARRKAWQGREIAIDPDGWGALADRVAGPVDGVADRDRLRRVLDAIRSELSPHQREVLTALVLADVPIDVLAQRLNTTRGALYKTLHDARRKLRAAVGEDQE